MNLMDFLMLAGIAFTIAFTIVFAVTAYTMHKETEGHKVVQPETNEEGPIIDVWGNHVPAINKQPANVLDIWNTEYL